MPERTGAASRSQPAPAPKHAVPAAPAAAAPAAAAAAAAAPAPPGSVRLALQFRENSWVEVYDAGGARLLYDLATAGTERALRASAPLSILLGNPSGVDLSVDGRPVRLGAPPRPDAPLRLSLDGSGRVLGVRAAGAAAGPVDARP
jgi:cytoskeleton protein RodZ